MSDNTRIDELAVIAATERREALLERRSYALDMLAHCSGEAEAMWLEMIEDADDALEVLANLTDQTPGC